MTDSLIKTGATMQEKTNEIIERPTAVIDMTEPLAEIVIRTAITVALLLLSAFGIKSPLVESIRASFCETKTR